MQPIANCVFDAADILAKDQPYWFQIVDPDSVDGSFVCDDVVGQLYKIEGVLEWIQKVWQLGLNSAAFQSDYNNDWRELIRYLRENGSPIEDKVAKPLKIVLTTDHVDLQLDGKKRVTIVIEDID